MRRNITSILAFVYVMLISVSFFPGCGKKTDLVVATIEGKKITVGDLRRAGEKVSSKAQQGTMSNEDWRKCLDLLVNKELILLEAQKRELDKQEKVTEALKETKRRLLLNKLYEVEVQNKTEVSDELARKHFDEEGLNRRVNISQIVVDTEFEAKQILKDLAAGEDFAELARQRSTDKRTAQQGGDSGWFLHDELAPYLKQAAFSLEVGQVSQPLKTHSGHCILKVNDRKEVAFEEIKDKIKSKLFPEAIVQRRKEHSNSLRVDSHLKYEPQGMTAFMNAQMKSGQQLPALSPEEAKTVLYRFDKGELTLADLAPGVRKLCGTCLYPAVGDSAGWKPIADQVVLEHVLLPRAAIRLGLHKDEVILTQLEQNKKEFMAERLREIEVTDKLNVTEQQVEDYFNNHRDDYMAPPRAEIIDILLKEKKEALAILREIKNGADMAKLAEERSILKRPGTMRWKFPVVNDKRAESIFGEDFVRAVFEATVGEIAGPIEARGGYAVFKVLKKDPAQRQSFEKMKHAVTTLLQQQEEQRLLDELIENLREKYRQQIVVYEDVLQKVDSGETNGSKQY